MRRTRPQCASCRPKKNESPCLLSGIVLEALDRELTSRQYERGQAIFYEVNPVYAVHCIRSGKVKLYKVGWKGEPQVIRLLGAGDILGYRPALAGEPYAATAEAVETSIICALPRPAFLEALRRSPDLALRLMALMARELRVSEEQLLSQAQETVRQRTSRTLAAFFASGAEDEKGGKRIALPLRRREMAQLVGTTPETLTRTLKLLERQGLLRLTRSEIYVPDPAALKRIASRATDRD